MVKMNSKGKAKTIPTNLGMPTSSLSMQPPSIVRTLRSSKDKNTSKSTNNQMNENEQVPPLHREEDTLGKLTNLIDELRAQNAKQQEVINNLILERSIRTKSKTHVSEREVSSHRSTTLRENIVGSKPIIEEVHSPIITSPPKRNYDMLLRKINC